MNVEGKRIYLSGPMTGRADLNRAAFAEAREGLLRAGAEGVYDPASGPHAAMWAKAHEADRPRIERAAKEHDMAVFGGLYGRLDALALLPGWEASRGARVERDVAEWLGMDVFEIGEMG